MFRAALLVCLLAVGSAIWPQTAAAVSRDAFCAKAYPNRFSESSKVRLGTKTVWSADMSRYQVCTGHFGAPDGVELSLDVACSLVSAVYKLVRPRETILKSYGCPFLEGGSGRPVKATVAGWCSYLADVVGVGLGIFTAGATTSPSAGVLVWKGVAFIGEATVCIGLKSALKFALDLGYNAAVKHERRLARAVETRGKCVQRVSRKVVGISWSAVDCPSNMGPSPLPAPQPDMSLKRYAGHIVQWSGDTKAQKTAWLVGDDLRRRWIPSAAVYNCLRAKGAPGPDRLPSATLDGLPDLNGTWATCSPSVAPDPPRTDNQSTDGQKGLPDTSPVPPVNEAPVDEAERSPSVALDPTTGRVWLAAISKTGVLRTRFRDPQTGWSDWAAHKSGGFWSTTSSPATTVTADGTFYYAALDTNGTLLTRTHGITGGWSDYAQHHDTGHWATTSSPSLAADPSTGRVWLAAISKTGVLRTRFRDPQTGWSDWAAHKSGGFWSTTSSPATTVTADGTFYYAALDTNGTLLTRTHGITGGWSDYAQHHDTGHWATTSSPSLAADPSTGRVWLAAISKTGVLRTRFRDPQTGWSDWAAHLM